MDNAKARINNKMRKILILDSLYPEMIKVKNETKNKLESEFFGTGKMYQYYLKKILKSVLLHEKFKLNPIQ